MVTEVLLDEVELAVDVLLVLELTLVTLVSTPPQRGRADIMSARDDGVQVSLS
ncbi:hypothetical protein [Bradyrhizobium sp. LMG 9283]|uniref:hypothetical protein n=1 Tax=Bradyrhizobium sp. LMG 9283 TaxID=592064 RepID=UPI00388F87DB